jgi:hypothetical protein
MATKRLRIHKMSKLTLYMDLEQKLPLIVFERPTNFIVVANFKENQLPLDGIRLKKQAQAKPCAALEKIQTEFPNASSPMSVRRTPSIQHGNQGFIHSPAILDW